MKSGNATEHHLMVGVWRYFCQVNTRERLQTS